MSRSRRPLHAKRGTFKLKRGSGARDSRMHAKVLESSKYPEAVFTPDRIEGKLALGGASQVKVHGVFRIHGADHEVTMNADAKAAGDKPDVHITFEITYVAWG